MPLLQFGTARGDIAAPSHSKLQNYSEPKLSSIFFYRVLILSIVYYKVLETSGFDNDYHQNLKLYSYNSGPCVVCSMPSLSFAHA